MSWINTHETATEEGQGYLVSVSDMMASLLFLFIITLMVFVINFHEEKVKKEVETKKLKEIKEELTDAKEARKQLLKDLEESLKRDGVIVRVDIDKGLLRLPESILFESGKAELQEKGKRNLAILARLLAKKLPCYSGRRDDPRPPECPIDCWKPGRLDAVFIEGHTDNIPINTSKSKFKSNWELSAKRSINTFKWMMKVMPELKKLKNSEGQFLFGVSGYADSRPVKENTNDENRRLNRRIDIRFILSQPEAHTTETQDENRRTPTHGF
ncbi:OmpA/MotB family protein [Desulfovulcanus sp.]